MSMESHDPWPPESTSEERAGRLGPRSDGEWANSLPRHTRRDFLRGAVGGAAALGVGGLLAACGSSSSPPSSSTTTSTSRPVTPAKPRRGGTIRLGSTGGGSADTLDGNDAVNNLDFAHAPQLYECLVQFSSDATPQLCLADEVTPNADATEWTIRVKSGIEFHNGKELTSDDVIYTFNRIVKNNYSGASALATVDVKNLSKVDRYTVKVPMKVPNSVLTELLMGEGEMSIVPVGYDPKRPVGTGAFKFESFSPGVTSTFVRNPNYWRTGEPYVDSVVITDYSDETAQDNALLAGEIDCSDQLSQSSIKPLRDGGRVVNIWDGPGWVPFTMRVDSPPFNDVRVRQAMRLIVDRPQMREVAFGGYGLLGNDIFGISDPHYDKSIPQRVQDIDQAKFLLKQAGHENLTTTLVTAPIHAGAVEMAQVLKQQATAAGVTINLTQTTQDGFFAQYLKWVFSQDWWDGYPYLPQVAYSMVPDAPWDETHWISSPYSAKYQSLYAKALRTVNPTAQADVAHEMMKMDWDYGGYIIPLFNPVIAGQSPLLEGVVPQKTATPWINYYFRSLWYKK